MRTLITAGMLAASLMMAGATQAVPLYSTAQFGPGDTLLTLDEVALAPAAGVTNQFAAYGVTFSSGLQSGVPFVNPANFSGQFLISEGQLVPYSILFTNAVDAAGAYWEFNPDTETTVAAYFQGSLVESYLYSNANCCESSAFLGFEGIIFDEIRVSDFVAGTSLILDNIRFSAAPIVDVPEPFSAALLGIGALGLAATRRRKRHPA